MKKFLTVFLCAAMALSLVACSDTENPDDKSVSDSQKDNNSTENSNLEEFKPVIESMENFDYRSYEDDVEITKYKGKGGAIRIPETINGKMVLSIGDNAFEFTKVTNVELPNGVTSIGERAFYFCSDLTSITIPDNVTKIDNHAFYNCRSLTSINIGSGVTEIGYQTFSGCTSLTSITIPDSVTEIGVQAFAYCFDLTSITIPDSVTSIRTGTFYGCSGLTSVKIGSGVTSISDRTFSGCTSLTSIIIPDSVTEIGDRTFSNCENIQVTYKGKTYSYAEIDDLYAAING